MRSAFTALDVILCDRICQELAATELDICQEYIIFHNFMSEQQPNPAEFNSFADWCLHKDSLSEAAKHTVEMLLKCAGTSNIHEANRILSSRNKLHLCCNLISDITPLQSLTHLKELNLSDNLISDITPLQSLINLTALNLSDNQISDVAYLQGLTHLTSLYLSNNQISDIAYLQSLSHLKELHLDYNQISNITPLQSLTHLTDLYLQFNEISDITPLQSLTHLSNLYLQYNEISDITPLQLCAGLTGIYIYYNEISDITPLQSCAGLTSLDLSNNQISDITPLQSLTNLSSLDLSDNQISDIAYLQYLTHLSSLNLSDNQISDITHLQSLSHLTCLNLSNNQILDIAYLQPLSHLNDLKLSNNEISDIAYLQSLSHLKKLHLCGNQISDIAYLQSLTNLTDLTLSDNQISDLTPLQFLTNLTDIGLRKNKISDLTPLQCLTHLTSLYLSHNHISDLTPLQFLTHLTALHLFNNHISDLTPLQSLTHLTALSLSKNKISDLSPLQSLTHLTKLYLLKNKISDITPLQSLTHLTVLNLLKNKISDFTPLQYLTDLTKLFVNFKAEQKSLIEPCRQKWGTLANSTEPISHPKATTAIKSVYETLGLELPEITFYSSPNEAFAQLETLQYSIQNNECVEQFDKYIKDELHPFILISELQQLSQSIVWEEQLKQQLNANFLECGNYSKSIFTPKYLVEALALAEFCVYGLGIVVKPESQKLFECLNQLLAECGWVFAFENICIVCSRPCQLSLDSEYRLHAEGEPALEFPDGYKIYSYHGVTLPEKYGHIHPNLWQAQWLLEEKNAELRRVLIQGIGYARICSELQATELDCWKEYTLLKIDADIDGFDPNDFDGDDDAPKKEDIYLLKMICPSTGHIHALRVPPDVTSAKEAIRWVNWDIDSEEFSVQT